jgi:hypothetical protein
MMLILWSIIDGNPKILVTKSTILDYVLPFDMPYLGIQGFDLLYCSEALLAAIFYIDSWFLVFWYSVSFINNDVPWSI